jgi:hypothetical protein
MRGVLRVSLKKKELPSVFLKISLTSWTLAGMLFKRTGVHLLIVDSSPQCEFIRYMERRWGEWQLRENGPGQVDMRLQPANFGEFELLMRLFQCIRRFGFIVML